MNNLGPAFKIYSEANDDETKETPFDPSPRIGVVRGMSRQEYHVPKLNGEEFNRNIQPVYYQCATARPRHPFAGRHPCFPE